MGLFDQPHINVTLELRIFDVRAFIRAARAQATKDGMSADEAKKAYTAHCLGACAQMLLDPGLGPPGCEILESSSDEF